MPLQKMPCAQNQWRGHTEDFQGQAHSREKYRRMATHIAPVAFQRLCAALAGIEEWKMAKETTAKVARLAARVLSEHPVTKYFRFAGCDVWHFHPDCHHRRRHSKALAFYSGFQRTKPRSGEFCDECRAKARADKRTQARKRGK